MPVAPKRPCSHPGCAELVSSGQRVCKSHQRAQWKSQDDRRGTAASRGYNSRWQKARETFLRRNPLCRMCLDADLIVQAEMVDHVIPHRGNQDLFWDTDNWQSLCQRHHRIKTASEDGGFGNKPKT